MSPLDELKQRIATHCTATRTATRVAGLTLLRSEATAAVPVPIVCTPMVCVIAQGRKRVLLAEQAYEYGPSRYLITSVHLPVTGTVMDASPQHPYLALSLALDVDQLSDLLLDMQASPAAADVSRGIVVGALDDALLDAFVRLVRLLDRPADQAVLAPLIRREILYRLLAGAQAPMLRQIALRDSRTRQVSRVVDWLRTNYRQPFRMGTLVTIANMSAPSLHRHFKALTAMSPLQYQKQMRLQEARRLLVSHDRDAATVGYSVGYGSASQFSREYSRLFGSPPGRDAQRLLEAGLEQDA